MDGEHGGGAGGVGEGEVGGGETGLPVVAVDQVGPPVADAAEADVGGDPREQAVAAVIVRPVAAVRAEIGVAGAGVEVRRIQDQEVEAGGAAGQEPHRPAHGFGEVDRTAALAFQPGEDGGVARHQRAHLDAERRQRTRQGAGDVGEAAGLDQREELGGDRQDAHGRQPPSRSIIGWVIRTVPLSVRRKRLASSSGSSPTTSFSGILHAAVDDHVLEPGMAADLDVGLHHRTLERRRRSGPGRR